MAVMAGAAKRELDHMSLARDDPELPAVAISGPPRYQGSADSGRLDPAKQGYPEAAQRPWQIDGHRFVTISAATYGNPICIRLWQD
jgi:hypothetical protein